MKKKGAKIKVEAHHEKLYIFTTSFRTDISKLDEFLWEQNQVIDSFDYLKNI